VPSQLLERKAVGEMGTVGFIISKMLHRHSLLSSFDGTAWKYCACRKVLPKSNLKCPSRQRDGEHYSHSARAHCMSEEHIGTIMSEEHIGTIMSEEHIESEHFSGPPIVMHVKSLASGGVSRATRIPTKRKSRAGITVNVNGYSSCGQLFPSNK
jgi:hypothetical protein